MLIAILKITLKYNLKLIKRNKKINLLPLFSIVAMFPEKINKYAKNIFNDHWKDAILYLMEILMDKLLLIKVNSLKQITIKKKNYEFKIHLIVTIYKITTNIKVIFTKISVDLYF